jgi:hypothetical protein
MTSSIPNNPGPSNYLICIPRRTGLWVPPV